MQWLRAINGLRNTLTVLVIEKVMLKVNNV